MVVLPLLLLMRERERDLPTVSLPLLFPEFRIQNSKFHHHHHHHRNHPNRPILTLIPLALHLYSRTPFSTIPPFHYV